MTTLPPAFGVELPLTGLECDLNEFELEVQKNGRAFAQNVLRPLGIELDKLSPEQVIAPDSKLWPMFAEFQKLGLSLEALSELPKYDQGEDQRCVVMVPLDLPGISRAKPLDKMGLRACRL